MEIKDAETKLEQADSFLTKLKPILKKHWGISIILLIVYLFYLALSGDTKEQQALPAPQPIIIENRTTKPTVNTNTQQPVITQQPVTEPYIVNEYLDMNIYGEIIYVQVWSDGTETYIR